MLPAAVSHPVRKPSRPGQAGSFRRQRELRWSSQADLEPGSGVRKGTRVLAPTPTLPAGGEGVNLPPLAGGLEGGQNEMLAGGLEGGQNETLAGELEGEKDLSLIPIENLRPGDMVYAHDGLLHRVLRLIRRTYRGEMVGIRHRSSAETLWLTDDHLVLSKPRPRSLGGNRDWSGSPIQSLERRRELRNNPTIAERWLWEHLRKKQMGVKFRRQHPIGPYIADFYSREACLVVEVDGDSHFTPQGLLHDYQRDRYLAELGLKTLRFTNDQICDHLWEVCLEIYYAIESRDQDPIEGQWVQAGSLEWGDIIYTGTDMRPAAIHSLEYEPAEEQVYDLEVEGAHSFISEVCALYNYGGGRAGGCVY